MGQGQSSDGQAGQNDAEKKTDFYELLEVDRQATEEEIKKAYRRKALELHPDRNYGNVEETTALFAEIQSAYQVLSDPQERAWYDSHREVFLGGGAAQQQEQADSKFFYNIQMTTADEVLKLITKYNGRMEYSESHSGFYGGLREFFDQLAKEEEAAAQWEKVDPIDYPSFGHPKDDYEDVVRPFYGAWAGFASKKSFSWKDKYRLSDAEDRRVRRMMEKENKGARDEAARDFNDAVRSLVAFVRKRDPRWQGNQKSEAERQKFLRDAAAAQSARSRAARQAKLQELNAQVVPEWSKPTIVDNEGGFSSEEEAEVLEIECVVCNKVFKSEAQYQVHEKSKKHLKLLKQLKREMRHEDQELGQNGVESVPEREHDSAPHEKEIDEQEVDDLDGESDASSMEAKTNNIPQQIPSLAEEDSPKDVDEDEDSDYAARSDIEDRLAAKSADHEANVPTAELGAVTLEPTPQTSDTELSTTLKPGKAKQKRAKKAAKEKAMEDKAAGGDQENRCAVCQASFPSKTKLFNHIKDKGHAAPVPALGKGAKKGKNR